MNAKLKSQEEFEEFFPPPKDVVWWGDSYRKYPDGGYTDYQLKYRVWKTCQDLNNKEQQTLVDEKTAIEAKLSELIKFQSQTVKMAETIDSLQKEINRMKDYESDSKILNWLIENKHLDIWWSVQGSKDRSQNIKDDISIAMNLKKKKGR